MSALPSDDYDPSDLIAQLDATLAARLGPVYRMAEPELATFLEHDVREALYRAFRVAESYYVNKGFREAQENGANLLKAVLAGAEVQRRHKP